MSQTQEAASAAYNPSRRHLAVMAGDYLDKIVRGEKTIESRLSRVACAPYKRVVVGDEILFKRAGGAIEASAIAESVHFYEGLTPGRVLSLVHEFAEGLMLEDSFIRAKLEARFATLIFLAAVKEIPPMRIEKRDRRGWVVLGDIGQLAFPWPAHGGVIRQGAFSPQPKPWQRAGETVLAPISIPDVLRHVRENAWRNRWWECELDERARRQLDRNTDESLLELARKRIRTSLATLYDFGAIRAP